MLVQLLSYKGKVPTRGSVLAASYELYSSENAIVAPDSQSLVS